MEGISFSFDWEVRLMESIQEFMGPFLVNLSSAVTFLGSELVLIIFLGLFYWGLNKELGKRVAETILSSLVWGAQIKNIFLRRRPYFDHEGIDCLSPVDSSADLYDISAQGFSFPSLHSANSVSCYGRLAAGAKKKWLLAVLCVVPFLIGISRFCVGVHYPTDVLIGWCLGLVSLGLNILFHKKIKNVLWLRGILLITALPGIFFCNTNDYFTGLGCMLGAFIAFTIEEKFVHFESTKKPLFILLRLTGGVVIFLAMNPLLKLPFSEAFLESPTLLAHLVRTFRYAIIAVVALAFYPMLFGKVESFLTKKFHK